MRRRAVNRLACGGIALAAVAGGLSLLSGSPAYATDTSDKIYCSAIMQKSAGAQQETKKMSAPIDPGPMDVMEVAAAQQQLGSPGKGVRIALVDSGVEGGARKARFAGAQAAAQDYHGTVSAGLIEDIAPQATLIDYPVLKVTQNSDRPAEVMTDAMANALQSLAAGKPKGLIVSVSLAVDQGSPKMQSAVETLVRKGAIVVASADWSGMKDSKERDLAGEVFPAAYPGVVTASASHMTAGDFTETGGNGTGGDSSTVLPDSKTTIAAPVFGAQSRTLNGQPCWVDKVTTGWAAAEVSGVLALIWTKYPTLSGPQVVDRLYRTASGRLDSGGRFSGNGVVDAYDAVTRPIDAPKPKPAEPVAQAQLGSPPADVLASVRRHAVWWGLGGGGALALGLILRPLFSRRRES